VVGVGPLEGKGEGQKKKVSKERNSRTPKRGGSELNGRGTIGGSPHRGATKGKADEKGPKGEGVPGVTLKGKNNEKKS